MDKNIKLVHDETACVSAGDQLLIGSDTWTCEGMLVTPDMRTTVLRMVAEMLEASRFEHYEWQRDEVGYGRFVLTDVVPAHETVGEFLKELTGERSFFDAFPTHYDALHEWLRDYFLQEWGVTIDQMEEDVDPNWDGEYTAAFTIMDWLEPLKCDDVVEWYEQRKREDNALRRRPSFLGVAVLARTDRTRPFSPDNIFWRTAVSEEEARLGLEVHVGDDLRDRLLALEQDGWINMPSQ